MVPPLGFGIIGCGNIAPIHAKSIQEIPNARLVAVSDVVKANAKRLANEFGAAAYTNYQDMLARDDVHAVCLCVPSGMRCELGEACASAGKHILAEKPLEVTTARIDRLIAATDRAGVRLSCIFQSRFADGPRKVKEAVDGGRFGKLILADAYIKWFRSQAYYDSGKWRGTWKLDGGGALMNQGIHQVDLLLWFMGPAKRVTAQTATVGHIGLEVEDLATALIEFRSGAMGVIEGSTAIWEGHPTRVEVHGTEGSAVLVDGVIAHWKFKHASPGDDSILASLAQDATLGTAANDPIASLSHGGHRRQIQDFVESIQNDHPPFVEGREGRRAVELIEAIYTSAKEHKPVDLEERN